MRKPIEPLEIECYNNGMRSLVSWLVATFLVVIVAAGCPKNAGKEPVTTCKTPGGTVLQVGDQGPAGDGCNTCACNPDFTVTCTENNCHSGNEGEGVAGEGEGASEGEGEGSVDEGPCHDADGDGFYSCIDPNHPERPAFVDCDDTRWWVQPGPDAIEFADTPEDDNCNSDNTDFQKCLCGGASTSATDLASGMDLCGPQVLSAELIHGAAIQYGLVSSYRNSIPPRKRVRSDDPSQLPLVIGNDCMMTMSSGDATGTETDVQPSGCGSADPDPDSTSSNEICDLAELHLHLHAPSNAAGFSFDFMFMSQEWPEYLCLIYNDAFYAVVNNDQAVRSGHATNTAFDSANRPITVNVGFFENPANWSVDLSGTPYGQPADFQTCPSPFDNPDFAQGCIEPSYCSDGTLVGKTGSGSGWLTTSAPVTPGADFDLTLSINDASDGLLDSLVLLDNFRWLPKAPPLQTVKGGG